MSDAKTHREGSQEGTEAARDFLREEIDKDLKDGRYQDVITRFPPEPNAYMTIGNAKAICINFGIADEMGGRCHLRFDDTNPAREEQEFVDAIKEDIRWLGFDWGEHEYYASDYFPQLYAWAVQLIEKGLAYVDDQSAEEMRANRGTLTEPGTNSPYRERTVAENLDLFERMKNGEFPDGAKVLRAKIDMASANINLRDPVMYRIIHMHHHRSGDQWCIYPMYDWAHGQSDSLEGVTHSMCSYEFANNRPLYEWFIEQLEIFPSRQIEFARGNITYTALSKRYIREMMEQGIIRDWDDPRTYTLRGLRRLGCPPEAVRRFWREVGVAKRDNNIDIALLEYCMRDQLNKTALRRMAVLRPLKVVIENYPEGESELLEAVNNPEDESAGMRQVPFSRELYIEREDFMEDPPRKFFRLAPGREVRLRYAYFITCTEVIKDDDGEVVELRCTYDPATRGGDSPDGRKVKATLHWVSAAHAVPAEARLYDRLFNVENPRKFPEGGSIVDNINPESLEVVSPIYLEPALAEAQAGDTYQFERIGYFCADSRDHTAEQPVFNRTVTLRDTWARVQKKNA
ncbi:MAG: glutamine--tRNA ligase/YqeY domain fusion protein [Candidatus Latescibacterota bacterium]|nr:glutamine--tRNA ligase/YqeY domain fusion protein [Candidatus Latescibacterota bacterium]MEE2728788.1 glutamine--tRNA ligase/YqeY domain fusion protein [Candidatus Latescibacterota bacterium]